MKTANQLIEKKINSKEVFKGKLLHVYFDEARLPNGGKSTREWIKHPGACAVVPIFENGDIMLLQQYRYPMGQIFWEVPAGKIDTGESQDTTATRELEEEAGLVAGQINYVGHFYPGIGYSDEVIHIYIAWDLKEVIQKTDEDEFVIQKRISFTEAINMVYSGEINDGKTIICLLRAWQKWQELNKTM